MSIILQLKIHKNLVGIYKMLFAELARVKTLGII